MNFTILESDLNAIKMRDQLATNESDTYLRVTPVLILDTGRLPVTFNLIQACEFIADITQPRLANWTFNAPMNSISLLFTEAVNITSLDPSGITILNSDSLATATQFYTLTGGRTSPNITDVAFQLIFNFDDLSAIQERTDLATGIENSYITLEAGSIFDMNGNEVIEVPTTDALQAIDHSPDLTSPMLEYFTFDLNMGLLLLTFSESVNVSSLNTSLFTIANGVNPFLPSYMDYTLTSGLVSVNDTELGLSQGVADHDVVVRLMLIDEDLNAIKALTTLATQRTDTRLYFEYGAVFDSGRNPIDAVITCYTPTWLWNLLMTTTDPELLAFDLNLNDGFIVLTFSETVNAMSLNFTEIMLTDHNINTTIVYSLTSGTVSSGDGTEITLSSCLDGILTMLRLCQTFSLERRNSYILCRLRCHSGQ